ncbi:hypothetical protein EVAR_91577_1 [Eumeta japonica]|uniref:Uncharacterized protein n=1 Tax=Eumeta variegata TaxID=151549 RepID=A0A4C1XAT0_EUMVA|nr:hypothetical protein EVAR_91577_1 [Eumeta japonica]
MQITATHRRDRPTELNIRRYPIRTQEIDNVPVTSPESRVRVFMGDGDHLYFGDPHTRLLLYNAINELKPYMCTSKARYAVVCRWCHRTGDKWMDVVSIPRTGQRGRLQLQVSQYEIETAGHGSAMRWDRKGIIHYELLSSSKTINSDPYRQRLMRLKQEVEKKRSELNNREGVVFFR